VRRRATARALAVVLGSGALLLANPGAAAAHPLGNFTVNRYSGLVVAPDAVTVDHVLDLAEIPTAQRSPAIDTNRDDRLSRPELSAWARAECAGIVGSLRLTVAGDPRPLTVTRAAASSALGQADLPILRLDCLLHADVAMLTSPTEVELADAAAGDQVGWREMTARGDGVTLTRSDVPATSRSRRLTSYPQDLLASPLDVRAALLEVRPGGARLPAAARAHAPGVASVAGGVTGAFQGLATSYDGNPLVALTALLAALALGAGHAVAPGHGKTIMAFYLSGRRQGSLRAATTVGATVTVTHTAGVLALGVLVSAGTAFVPARVYPSLTVLSGLLVIGVGLVLLRESRQGHQHGGDHGPDHLPGGHDHLHDHVHDHDHLPGGHDHDDGARTAVLTAVAAPPHPHDHPHPHQHGHLSGAASSPRGLVAIGLAGGLLPSPSAVLVFLGAMSVGHPWFGVLLVVAFGVGMATTLAAAGVLVMHLRGRVERRLALRPATPAGWTSRTLAALPLVTAAAVIVLGVLLALRGVGSLHS
jgi:nickel/cobalt transporter (NicO) family protein